MSDQPDDPRAETVQLVCTVNDVPVTMTIEPRLSLADLLRDRLRLTGTHLGCEHGVCGTCTVLVDGRSVRSCLMFAVQAQGRRVTTVEGLTADGRNDDLCAAFAREGALQCGFCTPGFLATATDMIEHDLVADEQSVREMLSGNLCRCTGYAGIVRAVLSTARLRAEHGRIAAGDRDAVHEGADGHRAHTG